jgi:hypothetical protein
MSMRTSASVASVMTLRAVAVGGDHFSRLAPHAILAVLLPDWDVESRRRGAGARVRR